MIKLMDLDVLLWDFAPVSEENLCTAQPVLFLIYIHGLKVVCMCFKAQFLNVEKDQIFLAILILHRWLTRIPLAELVWLNWIFRKRNHTHTALLAISTWNKEWISMTKQESSRWHQWILLKKVNLQQWHPCICDSLPLMPEGSFWMEQNMLTYENMVMMEASRLTPAEKQGLKQMALGWSFFPFSWTLLCFILFHYFVMIFTLM